MPVSNFKTSVVFANNSERIILNQDQIKNLIIKYNTEYKIKNFTEIEKFKLNFSLHRNYYYKNVMAFGDGLHTIHPFAGQGFNMILRDIKILSQIIQDRINLGLMLDHSIYEDFEKKTKHLNFIFSSGIDFIYEFFNFDNKYKNIYLSKLLKFIGKKNFFNKIATNYADKGLHI